MPGGINVGCLDCYLQSLVICWKQQIHCIASFKNEKNVSNKGYYVWSTGLHFDKHVTNVQIWLWPHFGTFLMHLPYACHVIITYHNHAKHMKNLLHPTLKSIKFISFASANAMHRGFAAKTHWYHANSWLLGELGWWTVCREWSHDHKYTPPVSVTMMASPGM